MARRVPRVTRLGGVVDQCLEERWQQLGHVVFGRTHHLAGDEALGVLEQEDVAVYVLEQLARYLLDGAALAVQEYRQVGAALALLTQEGEQALELIAVVLGAVDGNQHRRRRHIGARTGACVIQSQAAQHALVILAQLIGQRADQDAVDAR
ncbi:hypothetical protein D3C71_1325220 [compost metagenome]